MHYMEIEISDGSNNDPYEVPHLSNHTIIRVTFTGIVDSELFLHLPDDADVGDLFELVTIDNKQLSITNANVFGIASAEPYRRVLSVRKIYDDLNGTVKWLGAQSSKPTWV